MDGPGNVTVVECKKKPAEIEAKQAKIKCNGDLRKKMNEQVPSLGDSYAAILELAQNAPDTIEGQEKLNRALIALVQPIANMANIEVKAIISDPTGGVYGALKRNKIALEKQQGLYVQSILESVHSIFYFTDVIVSC